MSPRVRRLLAWTLWLASFGCCAAGLVAALLWVRPLTLGLLATGAVAALAFPLGYATVGLVLSLRRPANPIGWLYAASGLVWSLTIPFDPWVDQLILNGRPLPLAAQLGALVGEFNWAPAIALGITLPALLVPDGRLRSPPLAGGGRRHPGGGGRLRAAAPAGAGAGRPALQPAPVRRRPDGGGVRGAAA